MASWSCRIRRCAPDVESQVMKQLRDAWRKTLCGSSPSRVARADVPLSPAPDTALMAAGMADHTR
jgi:hypothetical protein